MINKLDNNYSPSFGTSAFGFNRLPKLVSQDKSVDSLLKGIDEGMQILRENKKLDDFSIMIKNGKGEFGNKVIKMIIDIYGPSKNFFVKRNLIAHQELDLFHYNKKTSEVVKTNKLVDLLKEVREKKNRVDSPKFKAKSKNKVPLGEEALSLLEDLKREMGYKINNVEDLREKEESQLLEDYSKYMLPYLHGKLNSKPKTIIKMQDVNQEIRAHKDLQEAFSQIDAAFDYIGKFNDNGLLEVGYTMEKSSKGEDLSRLVLNLDLYSSTLEGRVSINKKAGIDLFDFDKNMNVVNDNGTSKWNKPDALKKFIIEDYKALKTEIVKTINEL